MLKQVKKEVKNKNKGGRPTKYTKELADKICREIEVTEKPIAKMIAENPEFPTVDTYYRWLHSREEFSESVTHAKEKQCKVFEDSMLNIASDDAHDFFFNGKLTCVNSGKIQRDNMKISTIQKILSYRHERYRNNAQIKVEGSLMTATGLTTNELKNNARALLKECSKKKD